jgi:hypothetical protein
MFAPAETVEAAVLSRKSICVNLLAEPELRRRLAKSVDVSVS